MRHWITLAALAAGAMAVMAQDTNVAWQVKKAPLNVMGKPVKGAPYSADEVTETTQTLGDGTRIHNQSRVSVYRDGEGRVRRETPEEVTIWDPVAKVSYSLDPAKKTARKLPMTWVSFQFSPGANATASYVITDSVRLNTSSAPTKTEGFAYTFSTATSADKDMEAVLTKLKAEIAAADARVTVNGGVADQKAANAAREQLATAMQKMTAQRTTAAGSTESLGKQVFWGVSADGTRSTSTIDAGAIGNDRPISVVSERWYSEELQTLMMTRHSDPRTGEEIFRVENVRRGEPGADLFTVPPGYTMTEDSTVKFIARPDHQ